MSRARAASCRLLGAALASTAVLAASSGAARAEVLPAVTLDGPSADIVDLGGVAMADDGTGGVVYRRRVDGRLHVFVAQYSNGRWWRARQVDIGQPFDSSWPRIAAASGGRLLVTWVQRVGRRASGSYVDGMYAAWRAPGASTFTRPQPIDLNIGEATAVYPSLAMAANGGTALLSYVVTSANAALPGYVNAEYRISRYSGGLRWSRLPSPRRTSQPLPNLTAATAPKVAMDAIGNGVLGYIEPDDGGVDRVYVRRVFSSDLSLIPLQASPGQVDGRPVTGPADQFALGIGGFGEAIVLTRQQVDAAGGTPEVFVDTLPPIFSEAALALRGAVRLSRPAAGAPDGLAATTWADGGGFRLAYGLGSTTVLGAGKEDGTTFATSTRLGTAGNSAAGDPRLVSGPKGSGVLARRLDIRDQHGVEIRELPIDGGTQRAQVSADGGGTVTDLDAAGSTLGDAIVGFRSGSSARGSISASVVDAPPLTFALTAPTDWVRPSQARVNWEPARNAIRGVSYEVLLDGQRTGAITGARARIVARRGLEDGRHQVAVRATDMRGQRVLSNTVTLRVDATAPQARIVRRAGRRVTVRISDHGRSGLDAEQSKIFWGDGASLGAAAATTHTYRRRGRYRLTTVLRDQAGNRETQRTWVEVR